jgi:hypothetical protein
MKAICSFETSVDFRRNTWHYIPEDSSLQISHFMTNLDFLDKNGRVMPLDKFPPFYESRTLNDVQSQEAKSVE